MKEWVKEILNTYKEKLREEFSENKIIDIGVNNKLEPFLDVNVEVDANFEPTKEFWKLIGELDKKIKETNSRGVITKLTVKWV